MDILSERGYRISAENRSVKHPIRIDKDTFEVISETNRIWIFSVNFPQHHIRGVFGGETDGGVNPRDVVKTDVSEFEMTGENK